MIRPVDQVRGHGHGLPNCFLQHYLTHDPDSLVTLVTVTVTVTEPRIVYFSTTQVTEKPTPFPLRAQTVTPTCLELPYMKCCKLR
jgi:hypothetical protein